MRNITERERGDRGGGTKLLGAAAQQLGRLTRARILEAGNHSTIEALHNVCAERHPNVEERHENRRVKNGPYQRPDHAEI